VIEIDGASNRGIDEIRDLRERLRYLPSRSRYKVYIIDEVHMLTKEAFNALLKTLEEPPSHVVFIFATTELEKIPYTILSRCQRFEFKRVSLAGMVDQLAHIVRSEGITVSHASLLRIAKAAEGSVRDAQSLLDQVVAYCGMEVHDDDVGQILGSVPSERLAQCLQALFQQDAATALHIADALRSEGHETIGIVRALLEGLRHLIVLKTTQGSSDLLPLSEAELATLRPVAELATVEEIYGHFHALSAAEASLRSAINPFLVLEMALVRAACIGRVQPLQTILEKLEGLATGGPTTALPPVPTLQRQSPQPAAAPEVSTDSADASSAAPPPLLPPRGAREGVSGDFWEALQEHVAGRRPSVGAFLQAGRVLSCTDQELVIGFAKQDSFSRANLLEPENLVVVREAVQAVFGRPLQVKIVALDDANSNGVQRAEDGAKHVAVADEEMQRKKRETIQAVLDIFDGRLIM
jgi:DNA polymerase-3 subunit gamma/tau